MAHEAKMAALVAAGMFDPDAPDAAGRRALVEYLFDLGATVEDFDLVGRDEWPVIAAIVGMFPDRERLTLDEAVARANTTRERFQRVWRAAGFPDPDHARGFLASDASMFGILEAAAVYMGEEAVVQLVRVLGAAASRVADAAISQFVVNVGADAIRRDPHNFVELARANAETAALIPFAVDGFGIFLRHHLIQGRRTILDDARGVDMQWRTIGFVDLVDSTALSSALEPRALAEAYAAFDATAGDVIAAMGGRVVKMIGDEVMFSTIGADVAADIALTLIEAFAVHAVLPAVRAGLATGDVVSRDGDVAGSVVTTAARVVKLAPPGGLLCDAQTGSELGDAFVSTAAGEFSLKGFPERVPLFSVSRRD